MKNKIILILFSVLSYGAFAQAPHFSEEDIHINKYLDGTLTSPVSSEAASLVIMIQGSGPVDRNGNMPMMKSDFSKKIARQLAENGIASFRYDKRSLKMKELNIREDEVRFDDFIEDADSVINYFKENTDYKNLIVAGHSQGSLIGMIAAQGKADAYISLEGAGQPIDNVITEQIGKQAPGLQESTRQAFNELKEKGSASSYNPMLQSIFRPSLQPFMLSWMKYDPAQEIIKLRMPVLIINGTADIQVPVKDAEMLKEAYPEAKLVILDKMNHIFRKMDSDDALTNTKTYNEPNRPLHPELIPELVEFIKNLEK